MRHRCKPIGGSNPSLSASQSRHAKNPIKPGISRATGFGRWRPAVETRSPPKLPPLRFREKAESLEDRPVS
jgi:hypothetical protein